MKKSLILLVVALLAFSALPLIMADGSDDTVDIDIIVDNPNSPPKICVDSTSRSWNPNDQTYYTAELYGNASTNRYGDAYYDLALRGDYLFTGETVDYYVLVEDKDGKDDVANIGGVILKKDGVGVGSCSVLSEVALSNAEISNGTTITNLDCGSKVFNDATMKFYKCRLVVPSTWTTDSVITVEAKDSVNPAVQSLWSDFIKMNPSLAIDLVGAISFGTVEAGAIVPSNTVNLVNVGTKGVVMDMYIASEDYFTDPSNPTAICGDANGIPFTAFSYRATKGAIDSGDNNNNYPGWGEDGIFDGNNKSSDCIAEDDEFTPLPSHSGEITDMCRIINHLEHGSLLTQGQSMSLTFQLVVPTPCEGAFTKGRFHFAGRVV